MLTGQECRKWRERLGVKQTRMAVEVGLSPALLSRFESGLYDLKPESRCAIENYLQARLSEVKSMEFPAREVILQ